MEVIKNIFSFLKFTVQESGSKIIYGGSIGGGATSRAVQVEDMPLDWLLPYAPLIGLTIALLKLIFDFIKWRYERKGSSDE